MKEYKSLTKWLFKHKYMLGRTKKDKQKTLLIYGVLIACFAPMFIMQLVSVSQLAYPMYTEGVLVHFINMLMGSCFIVAAFFEFFSLISSLYFANDNEFLMSTPLKPRTIFLSKLTFVAAFDLILSCLIIIPSLAVVAAGLTKNGVQLGFSYYLSIPLAAIATPLLALGLVSILCIPFVALRFYLKKHPLLKSVLLVIGVALILGGYLAFMGLSLSTPEASTEETVVDITAMMGTIKPIIERYSSVFFITLFLSKFAMGTQAALNLLIFIAISIGIGALAYLLMNKTYTRCVSRQIESVEVVSRGNTNISSMHSGSIVKALIIRDIKLVLRDFNVAMNSLIGIIITPFICYFIIGNALSEVAAESAILSNSSIQLGIVLIFSLFMMNGTNTTSASSVSREGKLFGVNKYIPVDIKLQLYARIAVTMIFEAVGALLLTIVLAIVGDFGFINLALFFILQMAVTFATSCYALNQDLKKPMLSWDNVMQVVKQGTNILLFMMISWGIAILIGGAFTLISYLMPNRIALSWLLAFALTIALDLVLYIRLSKNGVRYFNQIEC